MNRKRKRAKRWLENIPESRNLTERQKLAVCEVTSKKFNVIWICILLAIFALALTFFKLGIIVKLQDDFTMVIVFAAIILMLVGLVKLRTYLIKKVIKEKEYEVYLAKQDIKMNKKK